MLNASEPVRRRERQSQTFSRELSSLCQQRKKGEEAGLSTYTNAWHTNSLRDRSFLMLLGFCDFSLLVRQLFGLSTALVRKWSSLFLRCAPSLREGRAQPRLTPGKLGVLTRLRSASVAVTHALETPEHALVPLSLGLGQQDAGATLRFAS
jgi:hypothetical protein